MNRTEARSTTLEQQDVSVRRLRADDLPAVVAIDAAIVGRERAEFFKLKLEQNQLETGIQVSLAAELGGLLTGFLLARVYYGEFGQLEPAAVLESLAVYPDQRGRGVGGALLEQLVTNLRGLRVRSLETTVAWDDQELIPFFHRAGFRPADRICLALEL